MKTILKRIVAACCSFLLFGELMFPNLGFADNNSVNETVSVRNVGRASNNVYIPAGLKFSVELVENISSKGTKKGSQIKIRVKDNILINDVVVVEKGSLGTAYIVTARKAGGLGRKGKLEILANEVRTINGIKVPLRGGISGKGKTDGGAGAIAAAVTVVGGLFMKGTNITYQEGTSFEVEVKEDVDLGCTKENLAKAMDPNMPHGISIRTQ